MYSLLLDPNADHTTWHVTEQLYRESDGHHITSLSDNISKSPVRLDCTNKTVNEN